MRKIRKMEGEQIDRRDKIVVSFYSRNYSIGREMSTSLKCSHALARHYDSFTQLIECLSSCAATRCRSQVSKFDD